tara:strand:+ start:3092 stop:3334 length:243 start_codon:yes stop_codon:yes gene_type:complete
LANIKNKKIIENLSEGLNSPLIIILTVIYFVITTFGIRITHGKLLYVQNRRQPSIEDLSKIANILDIDVRQLLTPTKKND